MADVIARHLFRYPRERASMLILEAQMARLLSPGERRAIGLASARSFLRDAEPIVWSLGSRSRVRSRFLLERIKVHRRLAEMAHKDEAEMYLDFCNRDLMALEKLVVGRKDKLWEGLYNIQKQSVGRVSKDVRNIPGAD